MKSSLRNQDGLMAIGLAIFMAALVGMMMFFSLSTFDYFTGAYRNSEGKRFSEAIANGLALKIRASYDAGQAPSLCVAPNTIYPVSGIPLCLPANRTLCTPHPVTKTAICISSNDGTLVQNEKQVGPLIEKFFVLKFILSIPNAMAGIYSPPTPTMTFGHSLNTWPTCMGQPCPAPNPNSFQCGTDADCLSFTFCPLVGGRCGPNQKVIQTLVFFK